jgi:hypothetical protein
MFLQQSSPTYVQFWSGAIFRLNIRSPQIAACRVVRRLYNYTSEGVEVFACVAGILNRAETLISDFFP